MVRIDLVEHLEDLEWYLRDNKRDEKRGVASAQPEADQREHKNRDERQEALGALLLEFEAEQNLLARELELEDDHSDWGFSPEASKPNPMIQP